MTSQYQCTWHGAFRRALAFPIGLVLACASLSACGLDESGLMDVPTVTPPFGETVDATAPPAVDADAHAAPAAQDASEAEAAPPVVVPDARPPVVVVDAAPETSAPTACDLDGDGHRSIACGGDDCCDLDSDVYPRTTSAWFTRNTRCGNFDFDCDGRATQRYTEAKCTNSGFACSGEGFMGIVPCGIDGLWQTCAFTTPGRCEANPAAAATKSQECR